jgi:cytochrome oxidase Cu insertion factor (SCO1/SenC/PrrC family)
MRKLVPLLLIASFVASASFAAVTRNGEIAPPFDLADLQGNRVSLESLKGNFVVIHFAASW